MAQSLLSQCRLLASMKADSTFNYGRPPYWQRKPNPNPNPNPPNPNPPPIPPNPPSFSLSGV
jgi:hypothetical protein